MRDMKLLYEVYIFLSILFFSIAWGINSSSRDLFYFSKREEISVTLGVKYMDSTHISAYFLYSVIPVSKFNVRIYHFVSDVTVGGISSGGRQLRCVWIRHRRFDNSVSSLKVSVIFCSCRILHINFYKCIYFSCTISIFFFFLPYFDRDCPIIVSEYRTIILFTYNLDKFHASM